jgi:hypothetical protein
MLDHEVVMSAAVVSDDDYLDFRVILLVVFEGFKRFLSSQGWAPCIISKQAGHIDVIRLGFVVTVVLSVHCRAPACDSMENEMRWLSHILIIRRTRESLERMAYVGLGFRSTPRPAQRLWMDIITSVVANSCQ